jgi:pilus assembly protein Flp/PilA
VQSPAHPGNLLYLEEIEMKEAMLALSTMLKRVMREEVGQDLIEYALIVALIAFAATVAMRQLATDINLVYTNIGTALSTDSAVTP